MPVGTIGAVQLLARRARSVSVELTSRCWKSYLQALDRHPARVHALSTCVLMASGDVIAQIILERRRISLGGLQKSFRHKDSETDVTYDICRTLRFSFVGLTMAGPAMHVWYRALDRYVGGKGLTAAVHKTAADQLLFLPVYLAVFVGVMGALRGDRIPEVLAKLRRDMPSMLTASYVIWPTVQLINFRFVPLRHRILVINVVCLFWNTYIGWRAEKKLRVK